MNPDGPGETWTDPDGPGQTGTDLDGPGQPGGTCMDPDGPAMAASRNYKLAAHGLPVLMVRMAAFSLKTFRLLNINP